MFTLNCKGRLLSWEKPIIMGIINATPDSFYAGSRFQSITEICRIAEQQLKEGATILDIGGQSTRPGSEKITVEEEMKRVIAPIDALRKNFPEAIISIDTYYAKVAQAAVETGASIVNDISGAGIDDKMIETVAALGVPYILTHIKGTPQTMQADPQYSDVTREVLDYFINRVDELRKAGIHDLIVDPGFGFGKRAEHNFTLLRNLAVFKMLDRPVMLGLSRKATIYKTLGITTDQSLNGTIVLNTIGLLNGASILRVHDIKEAAECINLVDAYRADSK